MIKTTIISILTIVGVFIWSIWDGGKLPMPFHGRTCQGRGWKRAFPAAQTKDIRDFLLFFVDAFAFSEKEKLKLNPDDRILEIYKTMYPSKWMADALEFETLVENLRRSYSVDLAAIWNENLTLGELFTECTKITPNTPLEPYR
jgi:propanediol dehydratase small subunit